jgi:hypothetical protein
MESNQQPFAYQANALPIELPEKLPLVGLEPTKFTT